MNMPISRLKTKALLLLVWLGLQAVAHAAPAQRIVSLLPSLTESVCALGECARLVGIDRYSNSPESVRSLPRVGGGLDPDIEGVVALKPDLVLIARSSPAIARLKSLGLNVVAMEPQSHADVRASLLALDGLLGVKRADAVWQQIERDLNAATQAVPPSLRGASVYFEVGRGPWAAGETSFIGQTLVRLGLRNIVGASLGPFPKINPEFVVQSNPKIIMTGESGVAELAVRPGWSRLDALVSARVCSFTPEESDALVRAGPRMAEAIGLMLRCLKKIAP
ncbi:MAG: ABC transporter substrate-binding protein [Rhodoferax sp.]|nr:ABC transporter substrate-binding protein [Rhodoferax sp.]